MGRRFYGMGDRSFYHVTSRVVDKRFIFGHAEKRVFTNQIRVLSRFTGVKVLTHCVMGNHFHLVVEVPEEGEFKSLAREGDAEALGQVSARLQALYGPVRARELVDSISSEFASGRSVAARALLEPILARMGSLSSFVRDLKWRFTRYYNRVHGRTGTLWEGRFRSVVVEGGRCALEAVCAYVDLNPVRAGVVADPADYPFSGYGEAVGGKAEARAGLRAVAERESGPDGSEEWASVQSRYRMLLYGVGAGAGFSSDEVSEVAAKGGALPLAALLRYRIRSFSSGAAVGSSEFLEALFEARREFFGARRRTGARPLRGGEWRGLGALRDLGGVGGGRPEPS